MTETESDLVFVTKSEAAAAGPVTRSSSAPTSRLGSDLRTRFLRTPQGAVLSIAVIARLGGVPRSVNRTASPGLTESRIFGDVVRNPIVMGGM